MTSQQWRQAGGIACAVLIAALIIWFEYLWAGSTGGPK